MNMLHGKMKLVFCWMAGLLLLGDMLEECEKLYFFEFLSNSIVAAEHLVLERFFCYEHGLIRLRND